MSSRKPNVLLDPSNPGYALHFSTVMLRCNGAYDEDDKKAVVPIEATGFFLAKHFRKGRYRVYLVTNKHVAAPAQSGSITWTLRAAHGGPDYGKLHTLPVGGFSSGFYCHGNHSVDVAIADLTELLKERGKLDVVYMSAFHDGWLPSAKDLAALQPVEEVRFLGYPGGYSLSNLPIVRVGFTATPPAEPFAGTPSFLIDGAVYEGSSGSPVVLSDRASGDAPARSYLLGVLAESMPVQLRPEYYDASKNKWCKRDERERRHMNLGRVFNTETILDCIKHQMEKHPDLRERLMADDDPSD